MISPQESPKLKGKEIKDRKEIEHNIQGLWGNKRCDVYVMQIPEEMKEKGTEEVFEIIITENFPY